LKKWFLSVFLLFRPKIHPQQKGHEFCP
jgi:hypothetical protein